MGLTSGTKLGPYEIQSPLGAGGMGEVYRARDTRLDREVAIKVLPANLSSDASLKQRLEREAKAVSKLSHPHICTLHDIGHQDGVDFLVMEYLEGETLEHRLIKGPLPTEQTLRYGAEIADALAQAHKLGITHRDLKPANVMLTKGGTKLMDFGLAKQSSVAPLANALTEMTQDQAKLTSVGMIVGTFQYMAPEQLEGKEADARTDIFAFGELIHEMVTGKPAFSGKSRATLIAAILTTEPPPVTQLQPLSPLGLERVIKKCLAKNPDERWQSASDLASQLKWIGEGGSLSGTAAAVPGKGSNARLVSAGLAAVAVGALSFAGWAWWRSGKPNANNVVRLGITMPAGQPILTSSPSVAISPDGRRLVFAVSHGGTSQLATREISSFELRLIPGTEGAAEPFFSPDGEGLAFFADGKLRKVSMSGGPPIDVADTENYQGGAWLPDGSIVYSGFSGGLMRVPVSGGKSETLTRPDASRKEIWHWWPQALPSGDVLFVVASGEGEEESNIAVLSMKSRKWTTVVEKASYPQYSPSGHIVYLFGGTLLAVPFDEKKLTVTGTPVPVLKGVQTIIGGGIAQFFVGRDGMLAYIPGTVLGTQNTLVSVDRTGKETALRAPPRAYEDLALSHDGKQLAMTIVGERQWSVWLYDLQLGSLNRVTFEGDNRDPIWSVDGKRIIYESTHNGHKGIFWKPVSGPGGEEELVGATAQPLAGSVSKDGRYVTFSGYGLSELAGIYQLPLQEERKPRLLFNERSATMESISPDGKWIAYESSDSGRLEVYVRDFATGTGKRQVSTEGGTRASWSADGKELFFRSTDSKTGYSLMSVAVSPGEEFTASQPRALFRFSCNQAGHDYAPTPDGQHFLCIKPPESEATATQVNVVLNWSTELLKK
ncbi:MAG: protein kinase [Candidatus Sulfotelmatobacter sp.]